MAGADPPDPFDWDDLRYFLHAARAGTLAGAARSLGVEHSTVGRRLDALEAALGAAVVQRGPSGLSLTPLGEQLIPMIEQVAGTMAAVRAVANGETARVRLAVPSGLTRLFAAALPDLRRAHPELSLELVSGARPVDLSRGEADLAVRAGSVEDADLMRRKLCTSGWSLYASAEYLERHPIGDTEDGFAGHDVVGFDSALSASVGARWLEQHAARATVVLRSREMTDMAAAAASGLGLALLPCLVAETEPALRRVRPEVLASHKVWLVWRREALLSPHVRTVADVVVELFRARAETGA